MVTDKSEIKIIDKFKNDRGLRLIYALIYEPNNKYPYRIYRYKTPNHQYCCISAKDLESVTKSFLILRSRYNTNHKEEYELRFMKDIKWTKNII